MTSDDPAPPAGFQRVTPETETLTVAEFVDAQLPALRRFAFALCGHTEQAEDLVADALKEVFGRWSQIQFPRAYARKVITLRYLNSQRAKRVADSHRNELLARDYVPDRSDEIDNRVDLASALMALAPQVRAVLILRYLEDRSIAETAEILSRPQGSIRRIAFEGIQALRLLPAMNVSSRERKYDGQ